VKLIEKTSTVHSYVPLVCTSCGSEVFAATERVGHRLMRNHKYVRTLRCTVCGGVMKRSRFAGKKGGA
jgi:uncharacterized Zn finger protein